MKPTSLSSPQFLSKLEYLGRVARKVFSGEVAIDRRGKGRKGTGTLFQEHRNYSPGDDPRTVDWNIYGRLGELFVKVFEPEEAGSISIFLDRSASMGEERKGQLATELVAALGYIGLVNLDQVRLIPFPSSDVKEYHGKTEVLSYLQTLERFRPEGGENLAGAVRRIVQGRKRGPLVFIVSDFYPAKVMEKALIQLSRNRVFCIHLVDPAEIEGREHGLTQFEDFESGCRRWIMVTSEMRRRYHAFVQAHLREVASIAAQRNAAYLRISSTETFDTAVLRILTQRAGIL